jgi:cytochrome c peroxidase
LASNLASSDETAFVLSNSCPASFVLERDGTCRLRTLYDGYEPGVGGLRVALPPLREHFTPREYWLGRLLFFDPILSEDRSLSCAHCHNPNYGFADGRGQSIGRGGVGVGPDRHSGVLLPRGAPSLWNVGFRKRLFWDGRATTLEEQAKGPLFSPTEMGNGSAAQLVRRLQGNASYRRLFQSAFGAEAQKGIHLELVLNALAAFESSLISLNSRYDWYVHGDQSALSPEEQLGHSVFRSTQAGCSQCHVPPLFTNGELAAIGAPQGNMTSSDFDGQGLSPRSQDPESFVVPSLRNVSRTAPYMHAGVFPDLASVVRFYNAGRGNSVPLPERSSLNWSVPENPQLTTDEQTALVAFLRALEDESLTPQVPRAVPSGLRVVATRTGQ